MAAVDHVLVSDDLLDAPFACHLGSCLGGCCVHGDSGAPLDADELSKVEHALTVVRDRLRPEALHEIAKRGPWEERLSRGTAAPHRSAHNAPAGRRGAAGSRPGAASREDAFGGWRRGAQRRARAHGALLA